MITVVPLKAVAHLNRRDLPEDTDPSYPIRYVDIGAVGNDGSMEVPKEPVAFASAPSRARRLAPVGSTVVSTVRTYLRAIARVSEPDLVFSTGFAVVEPRGPVVDGNFLSYALQSEQFVGEVFARSTGVSYPAIAPSELACLPVPLPAVSEQRRIADFLDDQVTRIDAAVGLRASQARAADAQLWAGFLHDLSTVQATPMTLRRVVTFMSDGPFGSAFTSADYSESGHAIVRLGNIGFAQFKGSELVFVRDEIYNRFPRCHVREGDVLVASLGDDRNHAGRACVAPPELTGGMVKGKCFILRICAERGDPNFLAALLSSPLGVETMRVIHGRFGRIPDRAPR